MTSPPTLPLRLVIAALVALCPAPMAGAVPAPPVDDRLVPPPRPPAPPRATTQQESCYTGSAPKATRGDQLGGLGLPMAWQLSRGAGQTVAVIDTGVARHRLLPHLVPGGDYVSNGDGTADCDGHGTVVAGIIGAATDSDTGFGGVAPEATIVGIRQSSNKFRAADDPAGSGFGDVDTLAMAVRTAADLGATVINISTVACVPADTAPDDRALGAALAYAVDVKNVVVVAAAGNAGGASQCPQQNAGAGWDSVDVVVSPAWYDDLVLTVGSVDPTGTPSRFSLGGPWVDVAAPGEGVRSLDPDGEGVIDALPAARGSMPIAGTSYAAPVVSGVAALVRARWPLLSARQVMQRIEDTAHRPATGWDPVGGHGLIDPLAALDAAPGVSAASRGTGMHVELNRAQRDTRPGRIALAGTAACLALAVLALSAARRRGTVTRD